MPGLKLTPFLQVKHSICCKPLCWDGSLLKYFFVSIIGVTVKKNEVRFFLRDSGNLCQNPVVTFADGGTIYSAHGKRCAGFISFTAVVFIIAQHGSRGFKKAVYWKQFRGLGV